MKTKPTTNLTLKQASMDDRIDILFRELELAIRWKRPSILLAVFSANQVHNEVLATLRNRLMGVGQDVTSVQMDAKDKSDIPQYLASLPHLDQKIIFVDGFNLTDPQAKNAAFHALNIGRDFFIHHQVRVVFWLAADTASELARQAPEFWGYRHRVVEFMEHQDPSQSPLKQLGSVWQGTTDFAADLEDLDSRIALRENLMSELPARSESTSQRANLLVSLGVLHWRKGDFEKAIKYSKTAIQLATRMQDKWFEAVCFNSLALIQANTGHVSEAVHALKLATKLAPDQVFPWNNLGNLFTELDRFEEAMNAFEVAMRHNPMDAISLSGLGNVYQKMGRLEDALTAFHQATKVAPTYAQPWNGLGSIYASQDKPEAAISAFQKAINLDNHLAMPWVNLGKIFEKLERKDEAAEAYRKAYELEPTNPVLWNEQGILYMNKGCYDEAVCAFEKSIELDHGNAWSYCNLAQTMVCKGKYTEAIQLYHQSLKLFKSNTEKAITWSRISNIYQRKNDVENAIYAKQIAIRLDPNNEQIQSELIEIQNSLMLNGPEGQSPVSGEAQPGMSGELSQQDKAKSARQWNEHGNALVYSGAFDEAVKAYQKAIDLDGSFGWPHANLARLAAGEGRFADAIPLYQKSLDLLKSRQERSVIWNRLGNVYRKMNDYNRSIQAHRKSLELDSSNTSPRRDLIRIHKELGYMGSAIEPLTASLDKAAAWNQLGNAYRRLSDYPAAIDAYSKASKLSPHDFAFRFDLEETIKESSARSQEKSPRRVKPDEESLEQLHVALRAAGEEAELDDNEPGPLGELIEMSHQEAKVAHTGDAFDPTRQVQSIYPIGQPTGRKVEDQTSLTRTTGKGYRNMWHMDDAALPAASSTSLSADRKDSPVSRLIHRAAALVSTGQSDSAIEDELQDLDIPLNAVATTAQSRRSLAGWTGNATSTQSSVGTSRLPEIKLSKAVEIPFSQPTISRHKDNPIVNNRGNLEKDILSYQTVTSINPTNARAWHSLGNLLRSAGRYDEAAATLGKAVDLDPKQEVFHYHLGLVQAARGNYENAIQSFNTVIDLNPNYTLAHATLAGYYRKLGMEKEYQYHFAIAKRGIESESEYNQACFQAICGNVDAAITLLKTALQEKQTSMDWVSRDPDFDNIRSDSRFQALFAG